MNTRTIVTLQASFCLAIVAYAASASAENNYAGAACIALSGSARPNSSGHIENNGAATATVVCPVHVDAATSGQATSGTPRAWVTDQSVNDVCCSARVKNVTQSVTSGGTLCSSGTGAGHQTLTLTNPATPGGNATFTHRWIQCDIPANSGGLMSEIRTYRY